MSAIAENAAVSSICKQLLDEWGFTPEEIARVAADIPGECEAIANADAAMDRLLYERAKAETRP